MPGSPRGIRRRRLAAGDGRPAGSPTAELAAFALADPALTIELVAAEPEVTSPVAIAWDGERPHLRRRDDPITRLHPPRAGSGSWKTAMAMVVTNMQRSSPTGFLFPMACSRGSEVCFVTAAAPIFGSCAIATAMVGPTRKASS